MISVNPWVRLILFGFVIGVSFSFFLLDRKRETLPGGDSIECTFQSRFISEGPVRACQITNTSPSRQTFERSDGKAHGRGSPEKTGIPAETCSCEGQIDDQIKSLSDTNHDTPKQIWVLNNLAALHIERWESGGHLTDLFKACEFLHDALAMDSNSPPALFNRALALEKLGLGYGAVSTWEEYLSIETEKEWLVEAKARRDAVGNAGKTSSFESFQNRLKQLKGAARSDLIRANFADFPKEIRDLGERDLLFQWAVEHQNGRGESSREHLEMVKDVAFVLMNFDEDHFLQDIVGDIESGSLTPHNIAQFAQARSLLEANRFNQAKQMLQEVAQDLEGCSHLADLGHYLTALCDYRLNRYDDVMRSLDHLIQKLGPKSYPLLMGRLFQLKGLVFLLRGKPDAALNLYYQALSYYNRTIHPRSTKILIQIADTHMQLDQWAQVWELSAESLNAPNLWRAENRYMNASEMGLRTFMTGYLSVSRAFLDEALRIARERQEKSSTGRVTEMVQALYLRGRTLTHMNLFEEGLADLAEAEELLPGTGEYGPNLAVEINRVKGETLARSDPEHAIEPLSEALVSMAENTKNIHLAELFYWRGMALKQINRPDDAEDDFLKAIEIIQGLRNEIHNQNSRQTFFNRLQFTLEALVQLQVEHYGDPEHAFRYVEMGRARTLLELFFKDSKSLPEPLSAKEIKRRLPPGLALISYAQLDDEIYIWLIREGEIYFARQTVPSEKLNRAIAELIANRKDRWSFRTHSQTLFSWLVEPVSHWIQPGDKLVFVPDQHLNYVPFAALVDGATDHYLIENHLVVTAPSATLFVQCSERIAAKPHWPQNTLAVGKINYGKSNWQPIGGEIDHINGDRLWGQAATASAFIAKKDAGVVHLGTHALANTKFHQLSRFYFAPEVKEAGPGVLYGWQLNQLGFNQTRLVVLAACDTATGPLVRTEGVMSLARPFLAGGVPAVVATLWMVPDSSTEVISTRIHRKLNQGKKPAETIRSVQLEWLAEYGNNERPWDWAGLQLIGGIKW